MSAKPKYKFEELKARRELEDNMATIKFEW